MADRIFYLIGPVSGYADCNRPAFAAARTRLESWFPDHQIVTPFDEPDELAIQEAVDHGRDARGMDGYKRVMRKMLTVVLSAEGLFFLPGSQESNGATVEALVATTVGVPVYSVDTWHPWRCEMNEKGQIQWLPVAT